MMKLHVIVNEKAGNGRAKKRWQALQQQLIVPYTIHKTIHPKHAQALVAQIATLSEPICILVIGGDGTINEVLGAARHYPHLVVGVITAGSGNDFSRAYPTFETAAQIEQFLQAPRTKVYDAGIVSVDAEPAPFFNNSGIGFDAFVANAANESKLKERLNRVGLGKLSYIYFVIVGLFQFQPFTLTVRYGEQTAHYTNVWFATVCNQPYFGGGMKLSPQSNPQDGQLELTVVHNLARLKFLLLFGTVFLGRHTRFREVEQRTHEQFVLSFQGPQPMHTDGETVRLASAPYTLRYTVAPSWHIAHV